MHKIKVAHYPRLRLDVDVDNPGMSNQRDFGEMPRDLLDSISTIGTTRPFKRYNGEHGQLKQGTKVWCNGYSGAIVRHYDGATYEIRVPGGVVATDDFELTDERILTQ